MIVVLISSPMIRRIEKQRRYRQKDTTQFQGSGKRRGHGRRGRLGARFTTRELRDVRDIRVPFLYCGSVSLDCVAMSSRPQYCKLGER
jgi:hypothetical protein